MKQPGKYALTGALAGLANGLFGSGGGLFLVPLFTGWAKLPQRKAFATSVAVILPLSLVSAAVYWFRGGLDVSAAWPYLLGGAVGGLLAGKIFRRVPLVWVRRAFGLLLLYGGVNWGLVGIFRFDLVAWLFGGQDALISRIIYTVVGIAALWCISLLFRGRDSVRE